MIQNLSQEGWPWGLLEFTFESIRENMRAEKKEIDCD